MVSASSIREVELFLERAHTLLAAGQLDPATQILEQASHKLDDMVRKAVESRAAESRTVESAVPSRALAATA